MFLLGAFFTGCQNAEQPAAGPSNAPQPEAARAGAGDAPTETAAPDVSVQLASWEEVERTIAAQRGKVVVLDVWSTWCLPCVREFPNLVALHRKHADAIACVSLNCNYTGAEDESPEDARPEVEAFLRKQGAAFTNIISTTPDLELFDVLGAASVPVVRVYDQEGKLRKQFTNDANEYGDEGFTYEQHIGPLVEQLVNE